MTEAGAEAVERGRRTTARTVARLALLAGFAVLTWFYIEVWVVRPFWHGAFDLHVYRGAMVWWREGHPVYDFHLGRTPFGFTYPPFAAVLMLPMAWISQTAATVITAVACAVAILVTTWWLLAPVARRHGWSPWWALAIGVPFVVAMDPVRETVGYLQVNLFLAVLILGDFLFLRHSRRWFGVGVGLATAIKLTPGLFIVYLAFTRRWRAAAVASGTFALATLAAHLFDPSMSATFWTSALWDTSRVGQTDYTENQSILGVLARLSWPGEPSRAVWAVLALVVLVAGMWRAVAAFRRGDELVGLTLTGLTGNLISPISWTHHFYWVVPAVVVLVDLAAGTPVHPASRLGAFSRPAVRARAAAVAAVVVAGPFLLSLPWFWKHLDAPHIHAQGLATLGESSYTLVVLLVVLLLPARALPDDGPAAGARRELASVGGQGDSSVSPAGPGAARTTAPPRPGGSSPR